MVFGVGDVEDVAYQRHALGTVKFGLLERAVGQARSAVADQNGMLTIKIGHHITVVAGIGDEQAIRFGVGQHLARIAQGGVVGLLVFREELGGREVQLAFELGDRSGHELIEHFERRFRRNSSRTARRRDQAHEGRPSLDAEVVPDDLIRSQTTGCLMPYSRTFWRTLFSRHAFGDELGRMYADHNKFIFILYFELREGGENVVAIDTAIGPEVEDDDLAVEILEANRPAGIRPGDAALERISDDFLEGDLADFAAAGRRPVWRTAPLPWPTAARRRRRTPAITPNTNLINDFGNRSVLRPRN